MWIHVEVAAEHLAVGEDFGRLGVLLGRHVAGLFQQRQVHVRLDVARGVGIAVPVPRAPEVAGFLDESVVGDALLGELGGSEHASEATTHDHDLGVFDHRFPSEARLDIGIAIELLVETLQLLVLADAVGAQTLLPLDAVPLACLFDADSHSAPFSPEHILATGRRYRQLSSVGRESKVP